MSHSEIQDVGIRMLFVGVRRSLNRIAGDVGLMVEAARRLKAKREVW
jgi:hypothetical protein